MPRIKRIKHKEPKPSVAKQIPSQTMYQFLWFCYEQGTENRFRIQEFQNEHNQPVINETDDHGKPLWVWNNQNPQAHDINDLIDSIYQTSEGTHWLEKIGESFQLMDHDDQQP